MHLACLWLHCELWLYFGLEFGYLTSSEVSGWPGTKGSVRAGRRGREALPRFYYCAQAQTLFLNGAECFWVTPGGGLTGLEHENWLHNSGPRLGWVINNSCASALEQTRRPSLRLPIHPSSGYYCGEDKHLARLPSPHPIASLPSPFPFLPSLPGLGPLLSEQGIGKINFFTCTHCESISF